MMTRAVPLVCRSGRPYAGQQAEKLVLTWAILEPVDKRS